MEPIVVLVTAASADEAARLADVLVEERLAACVNIVAGVQSVYRWQGTIERAAEWLLIIKTLRARLPDLIPRVQALHSYTVPEIIVLPVQGGSDGYLSWLVEQARPSTPSGGTGGG
ncbi:MAG: divalent-cation tolerance protein CutA [Armatimonadota bacterium]|nr:divalent-cation tolerance protein CutA [Armatimonadota bacterium]